jgi:hypothetical protein
LKITVPANDIFQTSWMCTYEMAIARMCYLINHMISLQIKFHF